MDLNARVNVNFVGVDVNFQTVTVTLFRYSFFFFFFIILISFNIKVQLILHTKFQTNIPSCSGWLVGWLVGCSGFNGPLRQYFSPYRAVSQREGERKEKK